VLRHSPTPGAYRHTRYAPTGALADWVQHFWVERWDLRDRAPQTREVLSHPCVHFVFARGRTRIYGVQQSRFVRELKGEGCVFGVKFRPGAFYPFLRKPVCSIANVSFPAEHLFSGATDAEKEVLGCRDDCGMVETASQFLRPLLPPYDPVVELACGAVEKIASDQSVTRVESLVALCGIRDRTLQRMFRRYIGASARWVIKRYRVYEALERLGRGRRAHFADLAQDLGYYDQAHFINDFKKLVGRSPARYLK
jgi:AraC-like DNA-binding protein